MQLPSFFRPFSKRHVHHTTHEGAVPPARFSRRFFWYLNPQRFRDFWFTHTGRLTAIKIFAIGAGSFFILLAALFLFFAKDLPSPGKVNSLTLKQTTRFYDRSGQHLLYEVYGDENRSVIDLNKIPKTMQEATIAIEDKDFYHHGAFSAVGIVRSALNNVFHRRITEGGSTITQQYVKNALLSPERTLTRKIKELILSIQIEQLYSKDDILGLYLNEIPYGTQAYGIQAAAKTFFDKDAKDLTLDESALLAALPQLPSYYSPYGQHTDELIARRDLILDLMAQQGYITSTQAARAKKVKTLTKINDNPNLYASIEAPHFVLHAENVLEEQLGSQSVTEGGLDVITTLDWHKQKMAEKAVHDGIPLIDASGGNNAALVVGDPHNGQILAMVGSRSFRYPKYGTFNAATANRQPGSSFKPYVYATGFKTSNWGPGSVLYDVRTDFGNYIPYNYDQSFHGAVTIRTALSNSFNIPAVKMLYIAGLEQSLKTAHDMGITTLNSPQNYGLSLVLGAGEVKLTDHVNGYETFASGGVHYDQTPILKVTDPKGKVVIDNTQPPQGKRVLDPQVAYSISSILSDNIARSRVFGFNNPFFTYPGHSVAIKTGTTDSHRDGWMMGYTKDVTVGVWVGNNYNTPMYRETGQLDGPIFKEIMDGLLKGQPNKPFDKPAGIKTVTLDNNTGRLPAPGSRGRHSDVFPSWYQPKPSPTAQSATIDKVSGKLATTCTPAAAREQINGIGIQAEIPPSDPAYARWNPPVQALAQRLGYKQGGSIPTEKDDVHKCSDKLPEIDNLHYNNGAHEIVMTLVQGSHRLDNLSVTVNGKKIYDHGASSGEISIPYDKKGDYHLVATLTDAALYSASRSLSGAIASSGSSLDHVAIVPSEPRRRKHHSRQLVSI